MFIFFVFIVFIPLAAMAPAVLCADVGQCGWQPAGGARRRPSLLRWPPAAAEARGRQPDRLRRGMNKNKLKESTCPPDSALVERIVI